MEQGGHLVGGIGSGLGGTLNELDFVTLGSVDESNSAAIRFHVRAIGIGHAVCAEMFFKFSETIDLESEMREIGLDLNRAAGWEMANLNFLLAFGSFEENELGAARRFVAARFGQAENIFIKGDRFFEVAHAIACVQKFFNRAHPGEG